VLREDFRPDSDVDVLLEFRPEAHVGLLDLLAMEQELSEIFGRPVDVVEPSAVTNPYRRQSMLSHRSVLYAA
jgi:predicted nucleotidyltransferase